MDIPTFDIEEQSNTQHHYPGAEGVAAPSRKCCEATFEAQTGWLVQATDYRKLNEPPRPRLQRNGTIYLMARPPLLCQGGDFAFPAGCPRRPCPADDLWVTLKHARRGGRAIQKISRSIRLSRGRGGFPINPKGKPPRLRLLRWLRQIFFDDAATLLAAVQGGE